MLQVKLNEKHELVIVTGADSNIVKTIDKWLKEDYKKLKKKQQKN